MNKTALLSAGGTGGHLFPAQALAQELVARGWSVYLATDERGTRYTNKFPEGAVHVVASATVGSKNPIALLKTGIALFRGYKQSRALLNEFKPDVAVGFGGYPSLPPLLAAQMAGVPTVLHEQNAVLGRANKILAKKAIAIAAGFSSGNLPPNTLITGNPLRAEILEVANRLDKAKEPYAPSKKNDEFNLLIVGGSQGAQFFGDTIPHVMHLLSATHKKRMRLTLQVRQEQVHEVTKALADASILCQVAPFFDNMGKRLEEAHLIIGRAGASTISEVAAVGRPSILVPYPFALDHDQTANARELVERGGGAIALQGDLDANKLAEMIGTAMDEPERLAKQAHAAAMTGKPNATQQLTDLVVEVAKGRYVGGGIARVPADQDDAGDRG